MKIELACQGCRAVVGVVPDDGTVHVSYTDIRTHETARAEWEAKNPPGDGWSAQDILSFPRQALWAVHCDACNPHDVNGDLCTDCYWFDAVRCNTASKLLGRTAHLMEKSWLGSTNWSEFIRRFGDDA